MRSFSQAYTLSRCDTGTFIHAINKYNGMPALRTVDVPTHEALLRRWQKLSDLGTLQEQAKQAESRTSTGTC